MTEIIYILGGFTACMVMYGALIVALIKSNTKLIQQNTELMLLIGDIISRDEPEDAQ